jgi:predicted SprT family Zn-dependent metalloprotease
MDKVKNFYAQEEFATDPTAKLLVERYNPQSIMENSMTSPDTSYSENKGEKIVLCLRDKLNPPGYPLVDENTVMFVVLHEMAHLMTASLSTGKHTPEFWANFRRLLQDAAQMGIYQPVNYSHSPVSYCGMEITDSPL